LAARFLENLWTPILKNQNYQTKQLNLTPKFIRIQGSQSLRCPGIACCLRSPNVEGLVFWDVILSLGKWLLKFWWYKVLDVWHGEDTGNVICTLKVLLEKLHISIKLHLNSLLQITQLQTMCLQCQLDKIFSKLPLHLGHFRL